MPLLATVWLAALSPGTVLAQNYNADYDQRFCAGAKGYVNEEMKRLKSTGGVCYAPLYTNGTGDSHLYANAMQACCEGGIAPVKVGPSGNAPWSDEDGILCGLQCVQRKDWPEDALDRFDEMRRFSRCMVGWGIQDFDLKASMVKYDIDEDLLWDGWEDGAPPEGYDSESDEEDESSNEPPNRNITADEKTCPGPRYKLEEFYMLDESLGTEDPSPDGPYCTIPASKSNPDWTADIMNRCCKDLGSVEPWPGQENSTACQRICEPLVEWPEDEEDEGAVLDAVKELNRCFLEETWSDRAGRAPFISCQQLPGNITLNAADTDEAQEERNSKGLNGTSDEKDDNEDNGETQQGGSSGGDSGDSGDSEDAASSIRISSVLVALWMCIVL